MSYYIRPTQDGYRLLDSGGAVLFESKNRENIILFGHTELKKIGGWLKIENAEGRLVEARFVEKDI